MEVEEMVTKINRKELRKQKLMVYLAVKGRLKPPNPKPYLRDDVKAESTSMSTVKDDLGNGKENQAMGKENQGPNALKMKKEAVKVQYLTAKAFSQTTGKSSVASDGAERQEEKDEEISVEPDSTPDPLSTPTTVKALIRGDRGGSSVVKYKITATPGYV